MQIMVFPVLLRWTETEHILKNLGFYFQGVLTTSVLGNSY